MICPLFILGLAVEESVDGTGVWQERVKLKIVAQKYFKPYLPFVAKVNKAQPYIYLSSFIIKVAIPFDVKIRLFSLYSYTKV